VRAGRFEKDFQIGDWAQKQDFGEGETNDDA
jgi:hypothetical protein